MEAGVDGGNSIDGLAMADSGHLGHNDGVIPAWIALER
jgi:hypothetical protein